MYRLPTTTSDLVTVYLTPCPELAAANDVDALSRYLDTSDPAGLDVPEGAIRVQIRPLSDIELEDVEEAAGPVPQLGVVIETELAEIRADFEERLEEELEDLRAAERPLLIAGGLDDDEAASRLPAGAAALRRRHRRDLTLALEAHLAGDTEARDALKALKRRAKRYRLELVRRMVAGVEPAEEVAARIGDRAHARPWTPETVDAWLDEIEPALRSQVIRELAVHAQRLVTLGKARLPHSRSRRGSETRRPTRAGAATPAAATSAAPAADAEARSAGR